MAHRLLITVASWEPRFLKGIERVLKNESVDKILMFYFDEYTEWSSENITKLEKLARHKSIEIVSKELSFETPAKNWSSLFIEINENIITGNNNEVLVDFTTMPRSIIWYVLFFLYHSKSKIKYVYHKAGDYNKEWLSRNPDKPRLVYKLSGIAHIGRPTLLVIYTGYDPERVENLIAHFEPKMVKLFVQDSNEYDNILYLERYQSIYKSRPNYEVEGFDSFNVEKAYVKLEEGITPFLETHNIIITSLGPKPSAIALFKFAIAYDEIGLCYIPSKEFNKDYSKGIGESISGQLKM